ncbi:putative mitochondrial carnitine O-acetyltransferase [Hypsizygus marmoreus]|uniref:Mitochondrial carnitine O-acetyltransferase n=1 Tax=Hypsizygus marmoreus TaxID=39966 RepID=A0A369JBY2_HYPMA|nr:putative mitochondrial carnitine O-acetyltransferase [Hypsizygus marmoreus]
MPINPVTTFDSRPPIAGRTFAYQDKLPKLPIPPLEDTCRRYVRALEALQDEREHALTKEAVEDFLKNDGPKIQQKLQEWAKTKDSYIEDFWYESYLSHTDPVVLALNPFFVLENDPSPDRGTQLPRAASLIISSLGFIHDLRADLLQPDTIRGIPLDMEQYHRLFGTSRIPTERGCRMQVRSDSHHVVVLRRGQFYWFDVLDENNLPVLTEREVLRNLQAIVSDADKTERSEVARGAIGLLSTENRKIWSQIRSKLEHDRSNASCLEIVDEALFIVCLDDTAPDNVGDLCSNFLCGTYNLQAGQQVGTCTNRWYDKLQIIVCADGAAGINFEHTGVDGHTVLRFAADIFTEGLMLLARSINPSAPTLFHAPLSPHAKAYKAPRGKVNSPVSPTFDRIDTTPKKLEWKITPEMRVAVRFAETRLSALICQNECQALEFTGYGKNFITSHGFSPDAFVQMAFQAAYFGLYGRIECVYEPAMTKAFLHGRTEAIRSVQPESASFTKTFFSDASSSQKVAALRKACEHHVQLTKECSQGLGQDRHLYALYCLLQRQIAGNLNPAPDDPAPWPPSNKMPQIFTDPGWEMIGTSIMSTSNCGNPALRLFGFGPVAADGYGIGYIIKEDRLSVCASSKHLQTRRFLDTLKSYLLEIQRVLIQLHRSANERPAPFVDHLGVLRDSKTGRPIHGTHGYMSDESSDSEESVERITMPGYSFFDSGDVELVGSRKRSPRSDVGKVIPLAEY